VPISTDSISVAALAERLSAAPGPADLVVLDVRTPGEFTEGHIPDAVNLPVDQLAAHAARIAAPDRDLVLVCQSGIRAGTARGHLRAAGAGRPLVLDGGMAAWAAAGHATRSEEAGRERWSLERQVRLTAGSIVLTGILTSLRWPKARFVSGAIGAGLVFSAVSNTCGMGAVLSRLPYNRAPQADLDLALSRLTDAG
jgi:rhodanese-related sulfurtransferase